MADWKKLEALRKFTPAQMNQIWTIVKRTLETGEQAQGKEFMECYTAVHDFCSRPRDDSLFGGQELYEALTSLLEHHLVDLRRNSEANGLLLWYVKEWRKFSTASSGINEYFRYLNRYWVKRTQEERKKNGGPTVLEVNDLCMEMWRDHVIKPLQEDLLEEANENSSDAARVYIDSCKSAKFPFFELKFYEDCRNGEIKKVQALLNQVDVNCQPHPDNPGFTPLHISSKTEIVQLLLSHPKIKVNKRNGEGETPLHLYCKHDDRDVVELVLKDERVDINAVNNYGCTPLYMAVINHRIEIVRTFFASGRALDFREPQPGSYRDGPSATKELFLSRKTELEETQRLRGDNSTQGKASSQGYDVFLSHAGTEKRTVVSHLVAILRRDNVTVFVDYESLQIGDHAPSKMEEAAKTAKIGLFLLSKEFLDRKWPKKELEIFLDRAKHDSSVKIIPYFHGVKAWEDLPDENARNLLQRVSEFTGSEFNELVDFESNQVQEIVKNIKRILSSSNQSNNKTKMVNVILTKESGDSVLEFSTGLSIFDTFKDLASGICGRLNELMDSWQFFRPGTQTRIDIERREHPASGRADLLLNGKKYVVFWGDDALQVKPLTKEERELFTAIEIKDPNYFNRILTTFSKLDINFRRPENVRPTPLLFACHSLERDPSNQGLIEIIKTILRHPGVDVNKRDLFGRTAAHYATCSPEGLSLLLNDDRVDFRLMDMHDKTPIFWGALINQNMSVEKMLISGKDLNLDQKGIFQFQELSPSQFSVVSRYLNQARNISEPSNQSSAIFEPTPSDEKLTNWDPKWQNKRIDVFVSFHGSEPFLPDNPASGTMRKKLVEPLAKELGRGGRSVFLDQTSASGHFPEDILQGILSTRGGGVALFIVTKNFLDTEWTQIELACAYAARQVGNLAHLRLLVILVDVTVGELRDHPFVKDFCDDEKGEPLWELQLYPLSSEVEVDRFAPGSIIDFITKKVKAKLGDDFLPGEKRDESFGNLLNKLDDLYGNRAQDIGRIATRFEVQMTEHQTLLDVLQRAIARGRFSQSDVGTLISDLEALNLDQGTDFVERFQYKWLAPWVHHKCPDLKAVKRQVEEWQQAAGTTAAPKPKQIEDFREKKIIEPLSTEKALGNFFEISIEVPRIDLKIGEAVYSLEGSAENILAAFLTFLWIETPAIQARLVGLKKGSVVLRFIGSTSDLHQILMKYFVVGEEAIVIKPAQQSGDNISTYFSFAELNDDVRGAITDFFKNRVPPSPIEPFPPNCQWVIGLLQDLHSQGVFITASSTQTPGPNQLVVPNDDLLSDEDTNFNPLAPGAENPNFLSLQADTSSSRPPTEADKLCEAVKKGDVRAVKQFLRNPSVDVNSLNKDGWSAFHLACAHSRFEILALLLKLPQLKVNQPTSTGIATFHVACTTDFVPGVKLLLNHPEIDVRLADTNGRTPLWFASANGHLEVIRWIIASGKDLDLDMKGRNDQREEAHNPIEIARKTSKGKVLDLLERFRDNRSQTTQEIREELGISETLRNYLGGSLPFFVCANPPNFGNDPTSVTVLSLADCVLGKLPEEIATFDHLTELDLSRNSLSGQTTLPVLKQLLQKNIQSLTSLSLVECGLTALPKEIASLKELKQLDVSRNPLDSTGLSFIVQQLRENKKLVSLSLRDIPLDPVIALEIMQALVNKFEAEAFTLKIFEAKDVELRSFDGLGKIPIEILRQGFKKSVEYMLDLYHSPDADPLFLTKLMVVGFENVGKTTLLDCLFPMEDKLEVVDKENNTYKGLVHLQGPVLCCLGTEEKWTIQEKCSGVSVPFRNYPGLKLTQVQKAGGEGNGQDLELHFGSRESRDKWQAKLDKVCNNTATHGIDIQFAEVTNADSQDDTRPMVFRYKSTSRDHFSQEGRGGKGKLELSVWDFAGQHDYYNNHRYFLSERSVFLVVWNLSEGKKGLRGLKFWFQSLVVHLPSSTDAGIYFSVIVVGTHLDNKDLADNYETRKQQALDAATRCGLKVSLQYVEVSCRTLENIEALKKIICETSLSHSYMKEGQIVPKSYFSVSSFLKEKREKEKYILDWETLCDGVDFSKEVIERALKLLHLWGECVYFETPANLSKYIVTDPRFLTKGGLVELFRPDPTTGHSTLSGCVTVAKVKEKLEGTPKYAPFEPDDFLDLLEELEVCYRTETKEMVVIPSFLPEEVPLTFKDEIERFDILDIPVVRIFEFEVIPKEIIARLPVRFARTGQTVRIEVSARWRYGLLLRYRNVSAVIRVATEEIPDSSKLPAIARKGDSEYRNENFQIQDTMYVQMMEGSVESRCQLMEIIVSQLSGLLRDSYPGAKWTEFLFEQSKKELVPLEKVISDFQKLQCSEVELSSGKRWILEAMDSQRVGQSSINFRPGGEVLETGAFISHAGRAFALADAIFHALMGVGITSFLDVSSFLPGLSLLLDPRANADVDSQLQLQHFMETTQAAVVILDKNFLKSEWCMFELEIITKMMARRPGFKVLLLHDPSDPSSSLEHPLVKTLLALPDGQVSRMTVGHDVLSQLKNDTEFVPAAQEIAKRVAEKLLELGVEKFLWGCPKCDGNGYLVREYVCEGDKWKCKFTLSCPSCSHQQLLVNYRNSSSVSTVAKELLPPKPEGIDSTPKLLATVSLPCSPTSREALPKSISNLATFLEQCFTMEVGKCYNMTNFVAEPKHEEEFYTAWQAFNGVLERLLQEEFTTPREFISALRQAFPDANEPSAIDVLDRLEARLLSDAVQPIKQELEHHMSALFGLLLSRTEINTIVDHCTKQLLELGSLDPQAVMQLIPTPWHAAIELRIKNILTGQVDVMKHIKNLLDRVSPLNVVQFRAIMAQARQQRSLFQDFSNDFGLVISTSMSQDPVGLATKLMGAIDSSGYSTERIILPEIGDVSAESIARMNQCRCLVVLLDHGFKGRGFASSLQPVAHQIVVPVFTSTANLDGEEDHTWVKAEYSWLKQLPGIDFGGKGFRMEVKQPEMYFKRIIPFLMRLIQGDRILGFSVWTNRQFRCQQCGKRLMHQVDLVLGPRNGESLEMALTQFVVSLKCRDHGEGLVSPSELRLRQCVEKLYEQQAKAASGK